MFRHFVVLVTLLFAAACTSTHAQGPFGKWFRGKSAARSQPPSYPAAPYGFSIGTGSYQSYWNSGFGYVDPYGYSGYDYDPYRFGSFRAPDLLNDPYFKERYRYDSRYPGRHRAYAR